QPFVREDLVRDELISASGPVDRVERMSEIVSDVRERRLVVDLEGTTLIRSAPQDVERDVNRRLDGMELAVAPVIELAMEVELPLRRRLLRRSRGWRRIGERRGGESTHAERSHGGR